MSNPAYLRHPSLHGDKLVFVSDDDLWLASVDGGPALRLTSGLSEPTTPCFSPDGAAIAYVSRDEHHPEVHLMTVDGGQSRRLTWLGPDVMVRGWTPKGHIVFVSTHGQPFFRNYRAYTLDPAGGLPKLLELGQVNHLSYDREHPRRRLLIGRNTADPARWKRYRGGTAGHLWVDELGNGHFRRLDLAGNITSPMWLGERIWYLSDAQGIGNLYSCRPDGDDVQRHTDHGDFYARHAQTDGKRIVYQSAGALWLFDPADDSTRRIALELPGNRCQNARRFVSAADNLGGVALHPQGHSLALDVRGKLFTMALWEGAVRQLGPADGARLRLGQWLADGRTLVVVSDASGEEQLEIRIDGETHPLPGDFGRITNLQAAPVGRRIALANHRNELWLVDLDKKPDSHRDGAVFSRIDHSPAGRCEDLAWSPDGAWLAYSIATSLRHRAIKLHSLADGRQTLLTQPEFRDSAPTFDPAGRYLYFLSVRTYDPVYDAVHFDLSFPRAVRPYLIALQAGGPPPFDPSPKGMREAPPEVPAPAASSAPAAKTAGGKAQPAKAAANGALPPIELDGIADRIAAFPVPEDRYGQIAGVHGGKVIWTVLPIVGAHGRGGHSEETGRIELFDFATAQAETIVEKADGFTLADDHQTLLVRCGKKLRVIAADRKPEPPPAGSDKPSRKSGWIDLERIRASLQPRAERAQMLREVWRLQRDNFWTEDLSGVDWDGVWDQYSPLLEQVNTRAELSDLIWEMQGELGTSHAYEYGGDHRKPPAVGLGQLAAQWKWANGAPANGNGNGNGDGDAAKGNGKATPLPPGYEITAIVRGDTWDEAADSPLNAIGVEAKVGQRIVAVNGLPVTEQLPPQALLVHQAGCRVSLTLAGNAADGSVWRRDVVAKALSDEVPALYREWVEARRRWVHAESNGRVGYLHLPDMMSAGYAEFHRYFLTECDNQGLIVDLRYNRGGHVSSLLLEKVARRRIGYDQSRWGLVSPYPEESIGGPVVALANEHSGSDGDIFSHGFKLMKLGPLVGTRTWGGVIGIHPRHALVDGTETTQPEFAFWFSDVGWGVENHGTDPDIPVDNAPQDAAAGRDVQLQTALTECLRLIDAAPAPPTDLGPRPRLTRAPLPARRP
ncbi:S41 family peptidase [Piscinibacter sakaiensis]|uniref:S41 family peptidase n=1 Tax=Piscinibacter sakaiensis TaxID=1547922 RepID=UPI003AAE667E